MIIDDLTQSWNLEDLELFIHRFDPTYEPHIIQPQGELEEGDNVIPMRWIYDMPLIDAILIEKEEYSIMTEVVLMASANKKVRIVRSATLETYLEQQEQQESQ